MMKENKKLLYGLFICLFALNAFGQPGKNDPQQGNNPYDKPLPAQELDRQRRKMDRQHGRDGNGMIIQPPAAQKPVPAMTDEEKEIARENLRNYAITLKRLQAPAIYYEKYASFLKNEDYALARLFVDRNCDEGKTVSVQVLERCGDFIPVKGGGSYYSFRSRGNTADTSNWWDLHFVDDKFKAGNDSVQTIIAEIGAVELESVNLDSEAFAYLKKYKGKLTFEDIKNQNEVLEKGIAFNNFIYSNSAPTNLNSTYVLRSIAYFVENEVSLVNAGQGLDISLAFKIVGREKDGSLILLWKELKKDFPRRKLKR